MYILAGPLRRRRRLLPHAVQHLQHGAVFALLLRQLLRRAPRRASFRDVLVMLGLHRLPQHVLLALLLRVRPLLLLLRLLRRLLLLLRLLRLLRLRRLLLMMMRLPMLVVLLRRRLVVLLLLLLRLGRRLRWLRRLRLLRASQALRVGRGRSLLRPRQIRSARGSGRRRCAA